jgi:hypothetical protein
MEILDLGFNDCQELPKMQEYKLQLKRSLEIANDITIRETPNNVDMAVCFTPQQAIEAKEKEILPLCSTTFKLPSTLEVGKNCDTFMSAPELVEMVKYYKRNRLAMQRIAKSELIVERWV